MKLENPNSILESKILNNKKRLSLLISKRDNLEREILNLQSKICNQEFALSHPKKEPSGVEK